MCKMPVLSRTYAAMKNGFRFDALANKTFFTEPGKSDVFFGMLARVKNSASVTPIPTLLELIAALRHERYYVAHNMVMHKGKTAVFMGEMVEAASADLVVFLQGSMEGGDLRDFLVAPADSGYPDHIIAVGEDGSYLYR